MKRSALFLLLAACLSKGSTPDSIPGRLDLVRLTDRIYIAEDHFFHRENSVVYIGPREVTVISATWTPATARLLAEKVREVTDKPIAAVINTHHHLDRTGGNPYFKEIGATVVASRRTESLMKAKWKKAVEDARKDFPGYPFVPYVAPDTLFTDLYEREGGKIRVLYLGPSHTDDGVVVYFPEEKVLFGDCMLKETLGYLGDANLAEYPKTLKRVQALKIRTIIAGHGTSVHGPELIDTFLELLKRHDPETRAPAPSR